MYKYIVGVYNGWNNHDISIDNVKYIKAENPDKAKEAYLNGREIEGVIVLTKKIIQG